MGCGSSKKVENVQVKSPDSLVYPKHASLAIKERNASNEVVKTIRVDCDLLQAAYIMTKEYTIGTQNVFISACVLPGFDCKGTISKTCQDRYVVGFDGRRLIAGAFDGHGGQGHEVAQFISENVLKHFKAATSDEKSDAKSYLTRLTERVNEELTRSAIESLHSGSTESLMMIDERFITTACVGDSRACLGTTLLPHKDPNEFQEYAETEQAEHLNVLRRTRKFPQSQLHAVQLSKESKPNDPDELFRIFRAGGKVERMKGPNGQPFGPFRVFSKSKEGQHLAMSRSLGDTALRDSGVVGTPIVTVHPRDQNSDYFCVTGSDGIWDVLHNTEVIDFIEAFRGLANKTSEIPREINVRECTIAQLLCEEARLRWLAVVEEEDVPIDDISAVIVEFKPPISASESLPESPMEAD